MLATKVVCPHCSKRLKTKKPLAVGKRVLCSGCGHSFPVRPDDATPRPQTRASSTGYAPPSPLAARRPDAPVTVPDTHEPTDADMRLDPDDDPTPNRTGLLIAGILGGLLVLAGTAVGVVLALADKKEPQEQAAAGPDSPPAAGPATPGPDTPGPAAPAPAPRPAPRADDESPLAPRRPRSDPVTPAATPPGGGLPSPLDPPSLTDPPPEGAWLPAAEQAKVNKAIDKGTAYLKKIQQESGTWQKGGHETGLAALPGLTLLECGANADDPAVIKAAEFVRERVGRLNQTYEIALAILFLDRLGDRRDRGLIRVLTLRLIAGQKETGGWTYDCPILPPRQELALLTVLDDIRPQSPLDLFVPGPDGRQPPKPITTDPGDQTAPQPVTSRPDGKGQPQPAEQGKATDPPSDLFVPQSKDKPAQAPAPKPKAEDPATKKPAKPKPPRRNGQLSAKGRRAYLALSKELKQIPSLQPPRRAHQLPERDNGRASDNSNTQFAILGLLAGGRHDVPTERALARIVTRFRGSQDPRSGGWNYHYRRGGNGSTPSMTGAGLLGMAVGLGLTTPADGKAPRKDHVDNPIVQRGLQELGRHIGKPLRAARRRRRPINLYFMWSVERVAMLYNLKSIAKKDWYAWGAEELLAHQEADGHWQSGGYPGASAIPDTCLALLFLKRANLAKDLSKKLEFFIEGKGLPDERK